MVNKVEDQTIKKFREILRRFEREVLFQSNDCCCNGVTLAQCHALLEIEDKDKISITELSRIIGLDKSTVSRTIDGLVNIGLVDRTIPEENRRIAILQLTKAGKKICQSINTKNNEYFASILSTLSDAEKKEFTRIFEKITNQMVQLRSVCTRTECKDKTSD